LEEFNTDQNSIRNDLENRFKVNFTQKGRW